MSKVGWNGSLARIFLGDSNLSPLYILHDGYIFGTFRTAENSL